MRTLWLCGVRRAAAGFLFAVELMLVPGCGTPSVSVTAGAAQGPTAQNGKMILPVRNIQQRPELPAGCEIVSSAIVLRYLGYDVEKTDLVPFFSMGGRPHVSNGRPVGPDPWTVFAGSPYESGYGCFAPVVTDAINRYFSAVHAENHAVNLTGMKAAGLIPYLDSGIPVIVWATISMKEPYAGDGWYLDGTDRFFHWPAMEHCLVLIGHSGQKAVFSDPLDARGTVQYEFSLFEKRYRQLFCQAVIVE